MMGQLTSMILTGAGLFLIGLAVGFASGALVGRRFGERLAMARLPLQLRAFLWREDRCPTCGRVSGQTSGQATGALIAVSHHARVPGGKLTRPEALCYHQCDVWQKKGQPCDL